MKNESFKILLVEDDPTDTNLITNKLSKLDQNIQFTFTDVISEILSKVNNTEVDLIICDFLLPNYSGLDLLDEIRNIDQELPFILVSNYISEEKALEAMVKGASDYIMKDNLKKLHHVVLRELINYRRFKEAEEKLNYRQKTLNRTYKMAEIGHWEYDVNTKNRFWSDTVKTIHEVGPEFDPNSESFFSMIKDEKHQNRIYEEFKKSIQSGSSFEIETQIITHKGNEKWVRILWESEMKNGECHRILGSVQNIDELRKRKEILRESLEEKETLLIEIHHRVKNNLAVISGILQLQAFGTSNEELQDKLYDSVSRINSMAAVHEVLYKSKTFSKLDFNESLEKLISGINSIFQSEIQLEFSINVDNNLELNINQGIPLSLIINEVVTNVYKHAYKGTTQGEYEVLLQDKDNDIRLVIEDFGKGIPEDFEPNESDLGFTLVNVLTNQLGGHYSYKSTANGTKFELHFTKQKSKGSSSTLN